MKREAKHDLLDGGLFAVVLHDVHLVHVARVAEGDELGDPAVVETTRQLRVSVLDCEHLVENGGGDGATLREDTHGSGAGLRQARRDACHQSKPLLSDEQRVNARGVVHAHAVGADDTALVLVGQLHQLSLPLTRHCSAHLLLATLLRLRFVEAAGNHDDVLGSLLHALFGHGHSELGGNHNDRRLNVLGHIHGRLVNRLPVQLSTYG